jgi:hypothetical protein
LAWLAGFATADTLDAANYKHQYAAAKLLLDNGNTVLMSTVFKGYGYCPVINYLLK